MADVREPRDLQSRESEKRVEYTPSGVLPDPVQDPNFSYRWVATHIMGALDPVNASKRFRDGWEPVKAKDHPELFIPGDKNGNVELGGLMLCRMPKSRALARKAYYERQNHEQMTSVDNNFMRNNDPRMPLFADRKSTVSRGAGFGNGNS